MEIKESALESQHPSLATSYGTLALIYNDLGDLQQAPNYALKAFEINEVTLDSQHPRFAMSYSNIASLYFRLGEQFQALEFIQKAIAIMESLFPDGHPHLDVMRRHKKTIEQSLTS